MRRAARKLLRPASALAFGNRSRHLVSEVIEVRRSSSSKRFVVVVPGRVDIGAIA
jgi:hypothetical protein